MDNNKNKSGSKPLPWGLEASKLAPASVDRSIHADETKLKSLAQGMGSKKKTPFQKHLEQVEAKKKVIPLSLQKFTLLSSQKEEDETAAVYADFLASFDDVPDTGSKAFVRGETILPSAIGVDSAIKRHEQASESKLYKPQPRVKTPVKPITHEEAKEVAFGYPVRSKLQTKKKQKRTQI